MVLSEKDKEWIIEKDNKVAYLNLSALVFLFFVLLFMILGVANEGEWSCVEWEQQGWEYETTEVRYEHNAIIYTNLETEGFNCIKEASFNGHVVCVEGKKPNMVCVREGLTREVKT